jgi:hypothetical protein
VCGWRAVPWVAPAVPRVLHTRAVIALRTAVGGTERMTDDALATYLNDHLAGAMFGSDLAEQLQTRAEQGPLHKLMEWLAPQIEEDRQTLLELMDSLEISKSTLKQATTWLAEKTSRTKFGGLAASENRVGTFMAIETLALGVEGKLSLWIALGEVADHYPQLRDIDLPGLAERARAQRDALERERLAAARQALQPSKTAAN